MPRRRRRRGSRKRLLVTSSIVLVLVGVAAGAVSTGAFSTIDTGRDVNIGVASGSDALLGLNITSSVSANTRNRLLTVTNNLGSSATITVTLQSSNAGTLYANGNQGSTVNFDLAMSNSETVDIEANRGNSLTFTIKAVTDGTTVIATRTVNVQKTGSIPIDIDIKPGSDSNPINPNSRGTIPVAILHTEKFNPTTRVNVSSLRFGAADEISLDNNAGAHPDHRGHIEDVDDDGDDDLVLHFPTEDTGFGEDDDKGQLVGKTTGGTSLNGTDSVKIVDGNGTDGDREEDRDKSNEEDG